MIRARQLGALLVLAHVAFAQTDTNTPAAPTVINMSVSGQDAEVRIDVSATAVITSAKVIAAFGDRISLDLPGVVYNIGPRRILVDKNGVHAVRIWRQSENPPLTRMLIELDRTTPYLLSSEGNSVVLRIGARLREQEQRASNEPAQPTKRQNGPVATGRTSAAITAAQAVLGVFRRPEKPTFTAQTENVPAPESLPQLQIPRPELPPAPTIDSIKEANPSVAVMTENPAPKVVKKPTAAQPPVPVVSVLSASAVAANSSSLAPAPAPKPATPAPAPEPAREISDAEMRALAESVAAGTRTVFHIKHVQQETAYLDGGRSSGLAEGMTLVIKDEAKAAAEDGTGGSAGGPVAEIVVIGVAETSAVTEIRTPKRDIVPGDLAFLSSEDTQAQVDQQTMSATRKYPAVITFTESNFLHHQARAAGPRP